MSRDVAEVREALRAMGLAARPAALQRLLERCGPLGAAELSALARGVDPPPPTTLAPAKRARGDERPRQEQQQQQQRRAAEHFAPHALGGGRKRRRQGAAVGSADEDREAAFAAYADPENGCVGPEGVLRLCKDLGVQPEDPVMIVLSWVMRAKELGVFTRMEFITGFEALQVRSLEEMRVTGRLEALRPMLEPSHPDFPAIYRFAYDWACEPGQRCISKDMAVNLWPIVLARFRSSILPDFIRFLNAYDSLRGIPRDLWMQTLQFIRLHQQVGPALLETFDPETGAWPVIIDDFVTAQRAAAAGS